MVFQNMNVKVMWVVVVVSVCVCVGLVAADTTAPVPHVSSESQRVGLGVDLGNVLEANTARLPVEHHHHDVQSTSDATTHHDDTMSLSQVLAANVARLNVATHGAVAHSSEHTTTTTTATTAPKVALAAPHDKDWKDRQALTTEQERPKPQMLKAPSSSSSTSPRRVTLTTEHHSDSSGAVFQAAAGLRANSGDSTAQKDTKLTPSQKLDQLKAKRSYDKSHADVKTRAQSKAAATATVAHSSTKDHIWFMRAPSNSTSSKRPSGGPGSVMDSVDDSKDKPAKGKKCDTTLRFDPSLKGQFDIVITWVNYSSPEWQEQANMKGYVKQPDLANTFNELKYALRSIEYYGLEPLVRHIYILMNDVHGPPAYLETMNKHKKLRFVPHKALFKEAALPTNNRNAIMWHIHELPLTDWFIYMEDDMILGRNFDMGNFYDKKDDKLLTYLTPYPASNSTDTYSGCMYHTTQLLEKKFGKRERGMEGLHTPILANRCILYEIVNEWPDEVNRTQHTKWQAHTDVHWQTAYWNYMIDKKVAKPGNLEANSELHTTEKTAVDEKFLSTLEDYAGSKYQWLNLQGPGISDEYDQNPEVKKVVDRWFEIMFPKKSAFEK
eukprot:GFYU01004647.1.p1 GENE.GFYU01004647.1~~GFYU01004647.1.p1  ORF type:complete len:608 (-),score=235.67 GFYU01004647.1:278-2101(-)